MAKPVDVEEWSEVKARAWIAVPTAGDDKYTRGVLGIRTGSEQYPGAAVLGVEAALRTGVGMVRYLGPERASDLVLQRRPEAVTVAGRVQAWLLGSGMAAADRDPATARALADAVGEGVPTVLDAGALDLAGSTAAPTLITPHYRELATLLAAQDAAGPGPTAADISGDPAHWAAHAADHLGVTVLLKGAETHIASPTGRRLTVSVGPAWLATAGTGDVLGGIAGALVATSSERVLADLDALAAVAATAALLHARAAEIDSAGGPLTALGVARAVPAVVRRLLQVE